MCIGKKAVIAAAAITTAAAAAAAARDLWKAGCCSSLRDKDPVTSLVFHKFRMVDTNLMPRVANDVYEYRICFVIAGC